MRKKGEEVEGAPGGAAATAQRAPLRVARHPDRYSLRLSPGPGAGRGPLSAATRRVCCCAH